MSESIHADSLRAALERHGLAPVRFERITTGKFNESWYVTLEGESGREVVLRVAPADDAGFLFYERKMMKQEPGLHRVIREKTSVPVAEVLLFDDTRSFIDRDFLVMERLPGTAMSQAHLSRDGTDRALEETGRHLRELHDNCVAGPGSYGYLGEHECMEPASSWAEAFRAMWAKLVEDIRLCGMYDDDEARTVTSALDPHLDCFDRDVPGALLHMDIWSQNILVDAEGHVTGLVDWDRALWGDREIEFAVLDYCGISEPAFWRGYGSGRETQSGSSDVRTYRRDAQVGPSGCRTYRRDESKEARVRWLFYYLYELQKYIVIRTLRGRRPDEAAAYKAHAARMLGQVLRR